MHYGFRIVEDMKDGLANWMDSQGFATLQDFVGRAVPNVTDWKYLNMKYDIKAKIDQDACIKCGLCHIACEDTSHQAITHLKDGKRHFEVIEDNCVGCNLCMHVCPVEQCITMQRVDDGSYANWTTHPNNPASVQAESSTAA
jgi:dihydropyrimidine dehydrogenase (NAD+) subunit PreA